MRTATISRVYQDDCTIGVLNFGNFRCFTLELPDKCNEVGVSCIPEGRYNCRKIISPSLGECIDILKVKNRTYIRIHKGNYTSQIKGCVLVGAELKDINGDLIIDVAGSAVAFDAMMKELPKSFELIIM